MDSEEVIILESLDGKEQIFFYGSLPENEELDEDNPYVQITRSEDKQVTKIKQSLDSALRGFTTLMNKARDFQQEYGPDEMTLEAGLKYDAGVNAFLVKAGSEVNFKVKMTWKKSS